MNTKKINIGDKEFIFYNEAFENSRNWGHRSELTLNGKVVSSDKVIYLNRTWESYRFQSVMKGALRNYINDLLNTEIKMYKFQNDIKRLSKDNREEVEKQFNKNNKYLFDALNKL